MKLLKKVNVNTYSCHVHFIITDDIHKVENALYKKHGGDKPDGSPAEGYTVTVHAGLYVMVLDYKYLTHNLIGHEIYHVTHRIANDRDIRDEESMAWICGFLSEQFYTWLNTDKVKAECDKLLTKLEKQYGGESTESI